MIVIAQRNEAKRLQSSVGRLARGDNISAMPMTVPTLVWKPISTKSPWLNGLTSLSSPPVTEIEKSLPRERWPSSKRIAASTELPSCTRAARRVGCGWGKWVIAGRDYDGPPRLREDYGRTSPDSRRADGPHGAELLVQVEDARVDQEGKGPKDHKGRVASSRPWSPVGAGTRDGPVGGQGLRQPTVSAAKSHLWSACILVHPPERLR